MVATLSRILATSRDFFSMSGERPEVAAFAAAFAWPGFEVVQPKKSETFKRVVCKYGAGDPADAFLSFPQYVDACNTCSE